MAATLEIAAPRHMSLVAAFEDEEESAINDRLAGISQYFLPEEGQALYETGTMHKLATQHYQHFSDFVIMKAVNVCWSEPKLAVWTLGIDAKTSGLHEDIMLIDKVTERHFDKPQYMALGMAAVRTMPGKNQYWTRAFREPSSDSLAMLRDNPYRVRNAIPRHRNTGHGVTSTA